MRHLPFLQALAETSGIDDPVWRDASGGYLVLRFFDRWLDEGPARVSSDASLAILKIRIRDVPGADPRVRDTLLQAVQQMVDAEHADPAVVSDVLLSYGKYLELAGRLTLAQHVCEVLIDALDPPEGGGSPLPAATALMQYGYVLRLSGQLEAASRSYERATWLAQHGNSVVLALRAQVGMANTLRARGNLGDAETLLDAVIQHAAAHGMAPSESLGRHSRGAIRTLRGRHVDAMLDFFKAYELTDGVGERERILGDMAAAAGAAGYRALARDTYRILAYTAEGPLVRSLALGNLLELAALGDDAREFESMRAQVQRYAQRHTVSAEHASYIALYTAYGVERFGSRDDAVTAYRDVITHANAIGLHQVVFDAEQHLTALLHGAVTDTPSPDQLPPDSLHDVVEAISALSELAVQS